MIRSVYRSGITDVTKKTVGDGTQDGKGKKLRTALGTEHKDDEGQKPTQNRKHTVFLVLHVGEILADRSCLCHASI